MAETSQTLLNEVWSLEWPLILNVYIALNGGGTRLYLWYLVVVHTYKMYLLVIFLGNVLNYDSPKFPLYPVLIVLKIGSAIVLL